MYKLARRVDEFEQKKKEFDVSLFEVKQLLGLTEDLKLPFAVSKPVTTLLKE